MDTPRRQLIVNADDFGQSEGINAGIIRAFEEGIVTSASLMVRFPFAAAAAAYARRNLALSVGLHFDVGEWKYVHGTWIPIYKVVDQSDRDALRSELQLQLEQFSDLTGRRPTHLDSHQHVHLREPLRSIAIEAAERLKVPLRGCSTKVSYRGDFYGQSAEGYPFYNGISVAALTRSINGLGPGVTELGCHPALTIDLDTMYAAERLIELDTLCHPLVREEVMHCGVKLVSFEQVVPGEKDQI